MSNSLEDGILSRSNILIIDGDKDVLDAVSAFLTTPPQAYAPLQSRIAERVGNYAARTSIWAQSGGGAGLAMVTLYEILANEYYLGPKIIIDFLVDKT